MKSATAFARASGLTAFGLAALFAFGCGGGSGGSRTPDELTGCGSDEQWITFDSAETNITISDPDAATLTAPDVSQTLAGDSAPVFQWNENANTTGASTGDVPYSDGPDCMACCPQFNSGALTTLHLPPISGDEYDLHFFEGDTEVYRVITTLQEWQAPIDVWHSWRGKSISLKMMRMAVLRNTLATGGGPFEASKPIVFQVGS